MELRDEITKAIEQNGPSVIDRIALRRIDEALARANGRRKEKADG